MPIREARPVHFSCAEKVMQVCAELITEIKMATTKLEKNAWHPYFDNVSKVLDGKRVEVEVASLKLGDQIEAEWLPLIGITYDAKDDLIEVALEGFDHMIRKPKDVFVDQEAVLLTSMEVIDADDTRQIIRLRDPLMLPPPA
jgi:hypothetical protein